MIQCVDSMRRFSKDWDGAQAEAATEGVADVGAEEEPDPLRPLVRLAVGRPPRPSGMPAPAGASVDDGVGEDVAVVLVPHALRQAVSIAPMMACEEPGEWEEAQWDRKLKTWEVRLRSEILRLRRLLDKGTRL